MFKEIDCRGLNCPQPVINTKKALDNLEKGTITIIVDNEVAKENVKKFAQKTNTFKKIEEKDGHFYITLAKGESVQKEQVQSRKIDSNAKEEVVVLIGNDKLGTGAEELGEILMKGYLYSLTEVDPLPSKLIFINKGVTLTSTGSPAIESIKSLEENGVEVISCGTCLDYYGLKDKLQVGEISNMYTIVEALNTASNTITV